MKKVPRSLLIAIVGVLFAIELSEQWTVIDPRAWKNGKCYFRGGVYKVGEATYDTKQCVKWVCYRQNRTDGAMLGLGCGKVDATPPCKLIPTREGINPECCEYALCGNRRLAQ